MLLQLADAVLELVRLPSGLGDILARFAVGDKLLGSG